MQGTLYTRRAHSVLSSAARIRGSYKKHYTWLASKALKAANCEGWTVSAASSDIGATPATLSAFPTIKALRAEYDHEYHHFSSQRLEYFWMGLACCWAPSATHQERRERLAFARSLLHKTLTLINSMDLELLSCALWAMGACRVDLTREHPLGPFLLERLDARLQQELLAKRPFSDPITLLAILRLWQGLAAASASRRDVWGRPLLQAAAARTISLSRCLDGAQGSNSEDAVLCVQALAHMARLIQPLGISTEQRTVLTASLERAVGSWSCWSGNGGSRHVGGGDSIGSRHPGDASSCGNAGGGHDTGPDASKASLSIPSTACRVAGVGGGIPGSWVLGCAFAQHVAAAAHGLHLPLSSDALGKLHGLLLHAPPQAACQLGLPALATLLVQLVHLGCQPTPTEAAHWHTLLDQGACAFSSEDLTWVVSPLALMRSFDPPDKLRHRLRAEAWRMMGCTPAGAGRFLHAVEAWGLELSDMALARLRLYSRAQVPWWVRPPGETALVSVDSPGAMPSSMWEYWE